MARDSFIYVASMAEVILRLEFANVAALATTTISLIILKGTVAHALHCLSIPQQGLIFRKNAKNCVGYITVLEETEDPCEVLDKFL